MFAFLFKCTNEFQEWISKQNLVSTALEEDFGNESIVIIKAILVEIID